MLLRRIIPAALLAAILALLLLGRPSSSPQDAAASITNSQGLAQVAKSETLLRSSVSLGTGLVNATDTPQVVVHSVGPLDLQAGDRVLVSYRDEFTNPTWNAPGAWTVGGTVSEHWSTPIMVGCGVRRAASVDPLAGSWVRRQTGQNFDGIAHHLVTDASEWDAIAVAAAGVYYNVVCYFSSSPSYRPAGASVTIENYGKIEAAVFRAG